MENMGVVEHLEELRKRLLITIGWFLVFLLAGFLYAGRIYSLLTAGLPFRLTVLGPSDVLWVYFALSGTAALAFTLPVAGLQCWLFVKPGLHANEQKAALSYIPFLFLLFAAGLLIGYFFVLPNIFHFLNLLGQGMFTEMYTVDKYFTFVFDLVVPFAACFDMPVIIMFLTSIGLIEPSLLRRVRRYAYFILVVVACCISPPDFVSHISVSIPLILLYECGVLLADVGYRRRLRRLERYEKA